jgi:Excalibur calcium-binding domain
MRKPAKIALGIFGSFIAIFVIGGVANAGNAPATATSEASATTTTPTATPAPTTSAAPVAPTADELFVSAVAGTNELVGVGRSICDAIGIPGVTHASLVGELGVSKWGAVVAEAVVTSAEVNLCPERRYAVPAVSAPAVAPAPQAQPAQPEPAPAPRRQPEPAPAPAPRPEPREEPSSAYYKNCDAARADGAAPLHAGDPGYRGALDRDKDGVACE